MKKGQKQEKVFFIKGEVTLSNGTFFKKAMVWWVFVLQTKEPRIQDGTFLKTGKRREGTFGVLPLDDVIS